MNRFITGLFALLSIAACTRSPQTEEKPSFYVSILPLRSLIDSIVGDDFDVRVLVPVGASPETFEPTARQFVDLNRAELIFNVGLIDFETALLGKIDAREKIVDLSRGIAPIAGSCSHTRSRDKRMPGNEQACGNEQTPGNGQASEYNRTNNAAHRHGVDPHVWTSPRALQQMAANAYEAIRTAYPDSVKYTANYEKLQEQLRELDIRTAAKIAGSGVRRFIVYHPALTYYARDYGLEQIAVEADGKEPSARQLARLIRQAREDGIRKTFYQSQFPASVIEVIARDIDARSIEIDPLREDVIANIDHLTDLITRP